jgi:hypothetical protein
MDDTQNQTEQENQQEKELIEKIDYVRNWIDLAPDFPIMVQAFMVKVMLDRGGVLLEPDEAQRVEGWVENFYKDLSTLMGVLEGHITVDFPAGQMTPHVTLTEQGNEWVKAQMPMPRSQPESE